MLRDTVKTEEVLDKLTSELIYSLETEIIKKDKLGLLDGMAGISLYLFYYGNFKNSSEFLKIAENILVEIFNKLNEQPNVVGYDFAEGRTGIFATLYFLSVSIRPSPSFIPVYVVLPLSAKNLCGTRSSLKRLITRLCLCSYSLNKILF